MTDYSTCDANQRRIIARSDLPAIDHARPSDHARARGGVTTPIPRLSSSSSTESDPELNRGSLSVTLARSPAVRSLIRGRGGDLDC